ncbi:MAG: Hsp20/alpha crystallin family protein [Chromatiales bacterium]|nr:MAG: Hsp20/alpha crystallin family protein [Chromatiales bacterium]
MSLVTWNPFRELDDMLSRYGRAGGRDLLSAEGRAISEWRPAADIAETDKAYIIKAELPEVSREDVEVSVHDGVITIKGERRYEKTDDTEKQHRIESFYGQFSRSFCLPPDVDQGGISAESKDGVLKVYLPKVEAEQPKSIEVKVN